MKNLKQCYFESFARKNNCESTGLLLVRIVAGIAFAIHGFGKIQNPMGWMGAEAPVPAIFQALAAIAEFGGGIFWVVGFLTPIASLGILGTMLVATFFHVSRGDPFINPTGGGSYELASVYAAVSVLLLLNGPGKFSVDAKLKR